MNVHTRWNRILYVNYKKNKNMYLCTAPSQLTAIQTVTIRYLVHVIAVMVKQIGVASPEIVLI